MTDTPKQMRGFALHSPEKRREIAAKGGRSVPAASRAFSTIPGLAAKAGKKGGRVVKAEDRPFSRDRDLARRAQKKRSRKGK